MIVRFDSLNRFEIPKFYLCNPGSKYSNGKINGITGMLTDISDEELVLNFNSVSELNFRMYRVRRDNEDDNLYTYNLFRSVQNRKMIFLDDLGFFIITHVDDGFDGDHHYKDISAESCEIEIQNKMIPFIADGTYQFISLLESVIATIPGWTIGEVDSNVESLYRTFEDVDTELNCLGFMIENMQDAYECIFAFDCIHRVINVYDQNNYVRQTSIHITEDDVINSLEISEDSGDLYTAISVIGDEDLNIVAVNPLGTNVIYNFDYYLSWMSDALRDRVIQWKAAVEEIENSYYTKNSAYYTLLSSVNTLQLNLEKLKTQLTMYRRCRENIIANSSTLAVGDYNAIIIENGGTPITVTEDIATTVAGIDDLISAAQGEYDSTLDEATITQAEADGLQIEISDMRESVNMVGFFTIDGDSSLLDELMNYIYEGSYTDEYITVTDIMKYHEKFNQMKTLYDRAVSRLERVSKPLQEFDIDVENFIFAKEFEPFSEQLETGCLINVEIDDNDVAMLFLSNITVNYDDRSLSLTFGNRFTKFDKKSLFENALGDIRKTSNTLSYLKEVLYPIKNGEFDAMKEYIENSRTLSKNMALSAADEEVLIDDTGYTGRKKKEDGSIDDKQVKFTHNLLVFTDDGWQTCKVAIGEVVIPGPEGQDGYVTRYGINAEYLIGDVVIGNNLHIKDSSGNDILTVVDGLVQTSVSDAITSVQSEISQTNDQVAILFNNISQFTVEDGEGNLVIDRVKTSNGYTFDSDGMHVYRAGEEIDNTITHNGMYVNRGDTPLLTVNSSGVDALNVTVHQFLIVGDHARFEPYGANRTGCFYI